MATKRQQAMGLITHYEKLYNEKYRRAPQLNRNRERWGFESMIDDMSYDKAKKVIEFYFKTVSPSDHGVQYLLYNYDILLKSYEEAKKDEKLRAELRRKTEERVKRFRERNGN